MFSRNKFIKYPHFQTEAESIISKLRRAGLFDEPDINLNILADKDDNKFLEVAVAASADFLITSNSKHFPYGKFENN